MREPSERRPVHLLVAVLVAGALFLALNVVGIVLRVEGHRIGLLLIFASVSIPVAVHLLTRTAPGNSRDEDE